MSPEANDIVIRLVKELSTMKYWSREIICGGYDACINTYGFPMPIETKDEIVDRVISTIKIFGIARN